MTLPAHVRRLQPVLFLAVVGLVMLLPSMGLDRFWVRQLVLVGMLALVVSGLNLTFGYAGELALGQAAVYATGAFVGGYFAKTYVNDALLALLVAAAASVLVGLLAGAPGIRLGGWMLAIASFFLVLLLPDIVGIIGEPLGGHEGLTFIPLPEVFGRELDENGFYLLVVGVTAAWFALFRNLIRSPRGAEFRILGGGEVLSASLGISTYRLKLRAYAVGAIPAGLAGCLFAYLDGYVSTSSFGLHAALLILAASVLGGMHTVYGALLGAALMQLGPMSSSAFEDYSLVAFGAFLLIGGVLLPKGLLPVVTALWRMVPVRIAAPAAVAGGPGGLAPIPGGTLEVADVVKTFGGVTALGGVSLAARPGRVTALIGPNGSGKTTLLNVVSGYYAADSGALDLDGSDVNGVSPSDRARAGVARTFQTPTIPTHLSVREVVRSGAILRESGTLATVLRLPSYHRRNRDATREVDRILVALGIADRAEDEAAALPLGTRRLVELGRALALRPKVLLLDEVASGLDTDEVEELRDVIGRLRDAGATVVLVEHNFDLIRAVADEVYVLAEGRLLSHGTAEEVAHDDKVRRTYLGEGPALRRADEQVTPSDIGVELADGVRS
jgi:branched-chain amino acid transport system permease protein